MYVNCEPVGEQPLQPVNSRIDLNGQILIAKVRERKIYINIYVFSRYIYVLYTI